MEDNFDDDEVENTKAFVVDYLTDSGSFSQSGGNFDSESLTRICRDYSLELIDAMFILDMLEDIFSAEKGQDS